MKIVITSIDGRLALGFDVDGSLDVCIVCVCIHEYQIASLKAIIEGEAHMAASKFDLQYKGNKLEDNKTLGDYNVQDNEVILVISRPYVIVMML